MKRRAARGAAARTAVPARASRPARARTATLARASTPVRARTSARTPALAALRSGVRTAARPAAAATLALLLLSGCDLGPSGPGTIPGTVVGGPTLGAVVLEVRGVGIEGFEGVDDTRAYAAPVAGAEGRHRVVLVSPGGGDMRFGMLVRDVGMFPPSVAVMAAAGTDDEPLALTGIEVRLEH